MSVTNGSATKMAAAQLTVEFKASLASTSVTVAVGQRIQRRPHREWAEWLHRPSQPRVHRGAGGCLLDQSGTSCRRPQAHRRRSRSPLSRSRADSRCSLIRPWLLHFDQLLWAGLALGMVLLVDPSGARRRAVATSVALVAIGLAIACGGGGGSGGGGAVVAGGARHIDGSGDWGQRHQELDFAGYGALNERQISVARRHTAQLEHGLRPAMSAMFPSVLVRLCNWTPSHGDNHGDSQA